MAKFFFSSSFLLFLGNWIGQIGLNWYVLTSYHNAVYLGLVNFCRLVPILILSVWAGTIADKYDRGILLRITISSSFLVTALLCVCTFTMSNISIIVILIYATLRGMLNAVETPVRQAVLPDLSERLNKSQAVSYHSFIINICRSIGPAIAGIILAAYHAPATFLTQAICYLIAALFCIPLHFERVNSDVSKTKEYSLKFVWEYFKRNAQASRIFITSLIIMATGFSYTTLVPVLVHQIFPGKSEIFGMSMTFCAIGGMIATLLLPIILKKINTVNMYYLSSCLFGLALLGVVIQNVVVMFTSMALVGLFSQWARTSNRIYFQEHVSPENRGKILSIVMMDRGMIPLGSLLMTALSDWIGVLTTFIVMGLFTTVVALIVHLTQRTTKVEESNNAK
ncbi:MFS transporter [Staphylococcus petrasii]|uniref:MFS transporter n=1 Tax=Staphylococcus petrasii TaxID=1276936 RepID=UPI000CD15C36|nr:MFS transporter [Staphylococcus petrasii]PNZ83565.1 MFS transporter [Staphylococcus petrasii]TGA80366.1 MFS transporter [Staphylococcus petrasii]SUM59465.1 transporter [Staphylococcus petrasii]